MTTAAPETTQARRQALSVGLATGAYGVSFGALSVAAGFDVLQTQALSALLFTGGSQFAIVSVIGVSNGELIRERLRPVHELAHLTVETR